MTTTTDEAPPAPATLLTTATATATSDAPPIEVHKLFNDINKANPSFFLDLRNADVFGQYHLRRSKNMQVSQCLDLELVSAQMSELRDFNKIALVFLTDETITASELQLAVSAATKWMEEAKQQAAETQQAEVPSWAARWRNIISVSHLDFERFYAAYPRCSSLYLGSVFPTNTEATQQSKTFPTDVLQNFLFLGNYYDATDVSMLQELGITHVLDATSENLSSACASSLGLSYLPIPVWDQEGADIASHFPAALAFISAASEAQGRVLVHCRAGISRSATLVMAYLMRAGHAGSLREALKTVVEQRPYVLPNVSFREQLLDYEMSLFSKRSFENDGDLLAYVSTMNFCWSGIFSRESDHDKIRKSNPTSQKTTEPKS